MTNNTDKSDNELIADFMGVKIGVDQYSWRPGVSDPIKVENLAYHKEWGWLMPVVEKIERIKGVHLVISELGCDIYSFGKKISDSREETKIATVYKAAGEFIHWYNSQSKQAQP